MPNDLCSLIADKATSVEIIKTWIRQLEAQDIKFSLAGLCRKAKISSRGLLADILNGRRRLPVRHGKNLGLALGMNHLEAECFALIIRIEQEKQASERQRLRLDLERLCKALKVAVVEQRHQVTSFPFAFEVFCAFGLFEGRPKREDLLRTFGKARYADIDKALHKLLVGGFIEKDRDGFGIVSHDHVVFSSNDAVEHLGFMKASITDAVDGADHYFANKKAAFFESVILSVNYKTYEKILDVVRQESLKWQSALEASNADALVRFNIQIYPIGRKLER